MLKEKEKPTASCDKKKKIDKVPGNNKLDGCESHERFGYPQGKSSSKSSL